VPIPVPDEAVSVGVAAPPPEGGELEVGGADVEDEVVLAGADVGAACVGPAVVADALGVLVEQGEGVVAVALLLPALAEAVVAVFVVALLVAPALCVPVVVTVAVVLLVTPLALVLALLVTPLGGLLVPPLGMPLAELAGVTFGVTGLFDLAAADAEPVGHPVVDRPLRPAGLAPWLVPPPPDVPARLPAPATP
jgi:hypothetical protein